MQAAYSIGGDGPGVGRVQGRAKLRRGSEDAEMANGCETRVKESTSVIPCAASSSCLHKQKKKRKTDGAAAAARRGEGEGEEGVDGFTLMVSSPHVVYTRDASGHLSLIETLYRYERSLVVAKSDDDGDGVMKARGGVYEVHPCAEEYTIRTDVEAKPKRLGMLLVGVGGNNGTTVMAGVMANATKMRWKTKEGEKKANWYGSLMQCGVVKIGDDKDGNEVHVPLRELVPTVDPNADVVVGGWDINDTNMADAMERAQVLDYDLQQKLRPLMEDVVPMKGIYDPEFIAANQVARANHVLDTAAMSKMDMVERVRADIRAFKRDKECDKVIVLWTANTERFSEIIPGVNTSADELINAIRTGHAEVSPSTMYAVACILEHVPFINGSPQNTFVPGAVELAEKHASFIAGDDFKSGQTKMKSVLMDFLVGAGIKPKSIVSYNHLGNNDGFNLSEQKTFRSKEISKSNVVDDMVKNNTVLYPSKGHNANHGSGLNEENNGKAAAHAAPNATAENIDHCVVIKYIPYVGDSKRALDEYTSEIFMNGRNTIVMHNTCEDSLLSAPIIVDMVLLMELVTRISIKKTGRDADFRPLHPIASLLSYMAKAPLVRREQPLINALSRQRAMVENFLKACIGLPPENNIMMEYK